MPTALTRRTFLSENRSFAAGTLLGIPCISHGLPTSDSKPSAHIKLSCAAYSFRQFLTGNDSPQMTLDDFIDLCAAMELDACEPTSYYFPDTITSDYLRHLKRKTFLLGLDVSGTAVGNNFCLPPGPERQKEITHVKTWIDYSVQFGAPCIRIFAGTVPSGHSEREARNWAIEGIRECCQYASQRGIFLALENHGGITSTAGQLLAIVDQIDSPWFGVNLDTGNFHTRDPYADLEKVARHAITVQVKTEVQPKGTPKTEADLGRIVDILRQVSYHGYLVLEYEASDDPHTAVPRYCDQLRKLIG